MGASPPSERGARALDRVASKLTVLERRQPCCGGDLTSLSLPFCAVARKLELSLGCAERRPTPCGIGDDIYDIWELSLKNAGRYSYDIWRDI